MNFHYMRPTDVLLLSSVVGTSLTALTAWRLLVLQNTNEERKLKVFCPQVRNT